MGVKEGEVRTAVLSGVLEKCQSKKKEQVNGKTMAVIVRLCTDCTYQKHFHLQETVDLDDK